MTNQSPKKPRSDAASEVFTPDVAGASAVANTPDPVPPYRTKRGRKRRAGKPVTDEAERRVVLSEGGALKRIGDGEGKDEDSLPISQMRRRICDLKRQIAEGHSVEQINSVLQGLLDIATDPDTNPSARVKASDVFLNHVMGKPYTVGVGQEDGRKSDTTFVAVFQDSTGSETRRQVLSTSRRPVIPQLTEEPEP